MRNGKYRKYEKKILQFLVSVKEDPNIIYASTIRRNVKIPRSSFYDVLGNLRYYGHVTWLGEPQDWTSMVSITKKGEAYLKEIMNKVDV